MEKTLDIVGNVSSTQNVVDKSREIAASCQICQYYKHCMDRSRDLPCTNYTKQVQTARHTMSTRDKRGDNDGGSKRGCDPAVYSGGS